MGTRNLFSQFTESKLEKNLKETSCDSVKFFETTFIRLSAFKVQPHLHKYPLKYISPNHVTPTKCNLRKSSCRIGGGIFTAF